MSKAIFMTGKVITRERVFKVEQHQDGTAAAIFKSRKWLIFSRKQKRQFDTSEAIEKVIPGKPPSYIAYFDNKTGQQLKLEEVFTGGIPIERLNKIRDAQTVLQAQKNIDKSYEEDKVLDRFMLAIALLLIIMLLFVIAAYYQSIATNALTQAINNLHIAGTAGAVKAG
jgi:hypothetical protein